MRGEKIATERIDTSPFFSMRSASSVESFADTCRKKLQRVALAPLSDATTPVSSSTLTPLRTLTVLQWTRSK